MSSGFRTASIGVYLFRMSFLRRRRTVLLHRFFWPHTWFWSSSLSRELLVNPLSNPTHARSSRFSTQATNLACPLSPSRVSQLHRMPQQSAGTDIVWKY